MKTENLVLSTTRLGLRKPSLKKKIIKESIDKKKPRFEIREFDSNTKL